MNPEIKTLKESLAFHPLYGEINTVGRLQFFMSRHIFCVWDFMSLLKSLQRELTSVELPWLPPKHPEFARLMNEIVLDEESDVPAPGFAPISHFQLYYDAMKEMGADTTLIDQFLADARTGRYSFDALCKRPYLPKEVAGFLSTTARMLIQPLPARAAVFFHSREDIIPEMFLEFVKELDGQAFPCDLLKTYLTRHIEADGDKHGPHALRLLEGLYQGDLRLQAEAESEAVTALLARKKLWDDLYKNLPTQGPGKPASKTKSRPGGSKSSPQPVLSN